MSKCQRKFTEPSMRPPQEASSLLLRTTQGCTWNKCNFCYVSRGYRFMAATPEEFEAEALARKPFMPDNAPAYLIGSNPFALPVRKLRNYAMILHKHYPGLERISMQSRIDDIARKSDTELRELRDLRITHLYIGTENGNEDVLRMMAKGHTAEDTVRQLLRLDAAGISYTNFYVLGLGGKGYGKASGKATAAMFNEVNPVRITTTGMTLFANAPVAAMARRGEFIEASEREKIEELRVFLENLKIDVFYDGIHYLNPLNYRFRNSDGAAKAEVLKDMDEILASCSDAELEQMVNRRMMISL